MHLLHEQSGGGLPASYDSYDSTTVKKIEGNTSRSTFMQNAVPPGFLEAALKYSTHFLLAAAKGFRWHKRHVLQSFNEHSVVQVTGVAKERSEQDLWQARKGVSCMSAADKAQSKTWIRT